ncbi:MAG: hypothetical protein JW861_14290 [Bacteroidales bacterium]|nr:hypothetical protein [Bacteroidales bacterium]
MPAPVFLNLGHSEPVTWVDISPDDRYLLTSSGDRTLILWDAPTRTMLKRFHGHTAWVNMVAFTHDPSFLLSASSDKEILLWHVDSLNPLRAFKGHEEPVISLGIHPTQDIFASGDESGRVKIWDIKSGKEVVSFQAHDKEVWNVIYSPDSRYIATCSGDHLVKVWDAAAFNLIYTFDLHTEYVDAVAFSPDSKTLVSGDHGGTLYVWNLEKGKKTNNLAWPGNRFCSLKFSDDGSQLLASGRNMMINVYGTKTWRLVKGISAGDEPFKSNIYSIVLSHSGKTLYAACQNNTLRALSFPEGALMEIIGLDELRITGVDLSADGEFLVYATNRGGALYLVNVPAGIKRSEANRSGKPYFRVSFDAADHSRFAAAGTRVELWKTEPFYPSETITEHDGDVTLLEYFGEGIFSGGKDNRFKISSTKIPAVQIFDDFDDYPTAVAAFPRMKGLAVSASARKDRNTLRMYDVSTHSQLWSIFIGEVIGLYSRDTVLYCVSHNGFKAVNPANGPWMEKFPIMNGSELAEFNNGASRVYVGNKNRVLYYDIEDGRLVKEIALGQEVTCLRYHTTFNILLAGTQGGGICILDADTGELQGMFFTFRDGNYIGLSSNGSFGGTEEEFHRLRFLMDGRYYNYSYVQENSGIQPAKVFKEIIK